ncbi:hypothetical protein OOK29_42665 [Streptomyces phaeochromogenes]|uniref:hypothetical protein n=1 Tax=Streptomyces TaxID=1883 RepID=UPI002256B0EF|nr:hypothetical protein [Streptomyces phaeochromogenes]MCX5604850.1 hypothetical protein [Streptomyces phaeochromogenes]
MGEGFEAELCRRAAQLRRNLAEAAARQDAWSVALHTVDLEDVERLGRVNGVELSGGADQAGAAYGR